MPYAVEVRPTSKTSPDKAKRLVDALFDRSAKPWKGGKQMLNEKSVHHVIFSSLIPSHRLPHVCSLCTFPALH